MNEKKFKFFFFERDQNMRGVVLYYLKRKIFFLMINDDVVF